MILICAKSNHAIVSTKGVNPRPCIGLFQLSMKNANSIDSLLEKHRSNIAKEQIVRLLTTLDKRG